MKTASRLTDPRRHVLLAIALWTSTAVAAAPRVTLEGVLERLDSPRGVCVVLGLPEAGRAGFVTELARQSELLIYFQSPEADEVAAVRGAAEGAGLLGTRVFADRGAFSSIQLADNVAGTVVVSPTARGATGNDHLRVLHPGGRAILGELSIVKPFPDDTDSWSHPFHGPDNNPQSTDRRARAPYLTQFLAEPMFCPMPEVSVAAGGRVFRAFGHIAHKANQNAMLNTLICANAYNGVILWKRPLREGFMIHRNSMIATPDTLFLADDEACRRIDPRTGEERGRIAVDESVTDGPVWKWMALEKGVLYALIGAREFEIATRPSRRRGLGHWPWGVWAGHDYSDPRKNFGSGRTLVAIDEATGKTLWTHREEAYLDSRGVCMKNGRIYYYSPEKFLACLDARTAEVLWRRSDEELLRAIGPNGRAQHYVTGYATTSYIKCSDDYLFFAGPQRSRMVVVRASDGELAWQKPHGNLQIVLRPDGVYAAGPRQTGQVLAYASGDEISKLPTRRACTRATGSIDSVFFRTTGGTVRVDTATNTAQHIAPMRPPCQDGVIISDGNLYWGPWMCGCQLSLYGHICLTSAGSFDRRPGIDDSRLERGHAGPVERFDVRPGDWPAYRGDRRCSGVTTVAIPPRVRREWSFEIPSSAMPTAPVAAGDAVFIGDRNGVVRALDARGEERWKHFTGGAIYFPPVIADGRVFVGSADGRVHALEAASGRHLWSFRVGPAERRIHVYGKLISTWPVAGGVVAHDGVVYAAAGIAHYDGTHVVALDAATGAVKWYNDTSGALSSKVNSGISLQGNLRIEGNELRFDGGGVYKTARYDLETGKCLNTPHEGVTSRFQTAFYPYYPEYSQFLSLDHTFPDGTTLEYEASYEGSRHSPLALLSKELVEPKDGKPGDDRTRRRVSDRARPAGPERRRIWQVPGGRYNSLIVAPGAVLAAGQRLPGNEVREGEDTGEDRQPAFLAAIDLEDGSDIWRIDLPAPAVRGGTAVDHQGRIVASLRDGRVLCFTADE